MKGLFLANANADGEKLHAIYRHALGGFYPPNDRAVERGHPSLLMIGVFRTLFSGSLDDQSDIATAQAAGVADLFGVNDGHEHRAILTTSLRCTVRAAILSLADDQTALVDRAFGWRSNEERSVARVLFSQTNLHDKLTVWVMMRQLRDEHEASLVTLRQQHAAELAQLATYRDRAIAEDELARRLFVWRSLSGCGKAKCCFQGFMMALGIGAILLGTALGDSFPPTSVGSLLVLLISCFAQWNTGRYRSWRDNFCRTCCRRCPQTEHRALLEGANAAVYVRQLLEPSPPVWYLAVGAAVLLTLAMAAVVISFFCSTEKWAVAAVFISINLYLAFLELL